MSTTQRKMACNLLVFVLVSVIFNAYGAQLNSDPAPWFGSPGPPDQLKTIANSVNQTNNTKTTEAVNASLALHNTNETSRFINDSNSNNNDRNNVSNRISELSSNEALINSNSKRKEYSNLKSHGVQHHKPTTEQIPIAVTTDRREMATAVTSTEHIPVNATTATTNLDKFTKEFIKLTEAPFRLSHKPCKNLSVNEYLLMKTHSPKIVKVDRPPLNATEAVTAAAAAAAAAPTTSTAHHYHHPISIDVTHDVFDAKFGLVKNIVYTVHIFFAKNETITDFYVESIIDKVHKGVFRSETSSNWHRKHKQHRTTAYNNDGIDQLLYKQKFTQKSYFNQDTIGSNNGKSISNGKSSTLHPFKSIRVDESGGIELPNISSGASATTLAESASTIGSNYNSSVARRNKRTKAANHQTDHCAQEFWSENLISSGGTLQQQYTKKWSFNKTDLKNKTVSFRILFRKKSSFDVHEIVQTFALRHDCNLFLKDTFGTLDYTALFDTKNDTCTVYFPSRDPISPESPGLLVEIKRLNIPCDSGGYISLATHSKLCGKLEDIALSERIYYFPLHHNTSVQLEKNPLFSLNYKLVDYCYNVTLTSRNNSILLEPKSDLECYFKIHLPYGNQIELNLYRNFFTKSSPNNNGSLIRKTNLPTATSADDIDYEYIDLASSSTQYVENIDLCPGMLVNVKDVNGDTWMSCIRGDSAAKKFSFKSTGNSMLIHVTRIVYDDELRNEGNLYDDPSVYLEYSAVPIPEIVSQCAFGWIAVNQFCISAIETALPWKEAEEHCKSLGGHLASIKSEREQKLIDTLLMNSATFKDSAAYWIGASDEIFEGDFRWSNGFPYTFSNWFPGWSEHSGYNKQPNDDGLSAQDCVEVRRYFRIPPAIQPKPSIIPLTLTSYMWNDRDCNEKNYFLCERPLSDEPIEKSWSTDCNKTIILSHNHLRASIWSPGFPTHYPDKMNCFTVIIAPKGHYIAIEFEEFVLENEPQCSYDYLEIIDSHLSDRNQNVNGYATLNNGNNTTHRVESTKRPSESNTTRNFDIFENFLSIYKNHHSYLIQTPEMGINFDKSLHVNAPRRICGDWNSKVKLLRYRSIGPILGLHFSSDYSHHFGGYKAKVVIKNAASKCADDRLKPFNGTCYLFVSYPEVDWFTAQQVCAGIHGELASVNTAEEQRFITTNIRNELDYSPQTIYWLGGKFESNKYLKWNDGSNITYKGWIQGQRHAEKTSREPLCLGLQWKVSVTPMLPSGLFWTSDHCTKFGGYVCKKKNQDSFAANIENQTITGTEGYLSSPNYPNLYPSNANYWIKLIGPKNTRIVIQFGKIDLEEQNDCLYDYVSIEDDESYEEVLQSGLTARSMSMLTPDNDRNNLSDDYMSDVASENDFVGSREVVRRKRDTNVIKKSPMSKHTALEQSFLPYVRWCGTHESNMTRFDFISATNTVLINFHSDYSVSGSGFSLKWNAVALSGCPTQTYASSDDVNSIVSPNFPNILLNNLDCTYVIYTASAKKIWLEFRSFDLIRDAVLQIDLGNGPFVPFQKHQQLNDGAFVSYQNRIAIHLRTGAKPKGGGFHFVYKTMANREQRSISLLNKANGALNHLNYPQPLPSNVDFTQHIIVPLGEVILLEIYNVGISDSDCHSANRIEIYDNYADINGSFWNLCKLPSSEDNYRGDALLLPSPIHITSYLNTIHIRQRTTDSNNLKLNASIRIQPDFNFKYKLATGNDEVESCQPNPCKNEGKCVSNGNLNRCQCVGHFTGRFCALTMCEMEPCVFGKCELTSTAFKCQCLQGYIGQTCEQKQKPCADNPCESRGECFEKNGKFHCRCHAWWEGTRCERRMMHIPYKPLSERMLQEPFWLGLITVFVVLAFIGLVWCAKRHFPEKIEKLLAEEADRNRPAGSSIHHLHNHHHPSLREQLHFTITNSAPQSTATTPGTARTIFGRLGIRKPSILSLSSPHAHTAGGEATARTFSLDDLLRPPPRRTPSPARKKRNNSTPTKNRAANEKRLILETLIAPATIDTRPKLSLDDLMIMISDQRSRLYADGNLDSDDKELVFNESFTTKYQANDTKFEKKVTFARLLGKVSAEISSGAESTSNLKSLNLPQSSSTELIPRPNSVPPTPSANENRSPHSTSSNQGSDSLSGSELAINDIGLRMNRRIKPKVSSADSILAMFRNFASTNVLSQMPSSITTTPSASPQDVADDDSSTSSMHTPISYTSCAPDSPISYHLPSISIEVPVLDPLNAHKSTTSNTSNSSLNPPTILLEVPSSNTNKCLSPIRELPTPIPSPALTPIMSRPHHKFTGYLNQSSSYNDRHFSNNFSDDDEKMSIEQTDNRRYIKVINSDANETGIPDKNTPKLLRPIPTRPTVSLAPEIFIDIEPPTPEERSPRSPSRPKDLILPQLIVQTPSPTRERIPAKLLGSPPPQRAGANDIQIFVTSESPQQETQKMVPTNPNKPATLELPFNAPTITINAIMTEMESDTDTMSPANIKGSTQLCLPRNDMCYLSPFSSVSRGDRTISESNLSSSGYSSMASPAPSRCGSSNPLYPNDDDSSCGPSGSNMKLHKILNMRRSSSHGKSCENGAHGSGSSEQRERNKTRSDSETLSDDILLESNDEGIDTDHIDEKIEEGAIKSAKELEHYIEKELLDSGKKIMLEDQGSMLLQLPTIVVQSADKSASPVSSRSESPISEKATGMNRFSPLFYNRKEQVLPFTDSDGLYDFPSSDGKGNSTKEPHSKKCNTRKRERKLSRGAVIPSPTKTNLADTPPKEALHLNSNGQPTKSHCNTAMRKSPKKRPAQRYTIVSSSSSTESLTSTSKARFGLYLKGKSLKQSDYDTEKEQRPKLIPPPKTETAKPFRKLNRLRAIGNQIRFLRRIEQSLRTKPKHYNNYQFSDNSDMDDDVDDSIRSDSSTFGTIDEKPLAETQAIDSMAADSMKKSSTMTTTATLLKSKEKESNLPPNMGFATKSKRSLSLNASHDHYNVPSTIRGDSFLDEANSD